MNHFGAFAIFIGGLALMTAGLQAAPPPKITLTGITTILGPAEALYTVAGGDPQQDKSYFLKEGQEEGGVAVVKIDTSKNVVTFSNHGVRQDIALANASSSDEQPLVTGDVTCPSGSRNPEFGDYDYAAQQSVTAPLNENQPSTTDAQRVQYQNQSDPPASDPPGQSASMMNGGGDAGGGPPGHGSF